MPERDAISRLQTPIIPEFLLSNNKENLLIAVGESWTYGEKIRRASLPFNPETKEINDTVPENFTAGTEYTLGPVLAKKLGCDLHQFAIPGHNNFGMIKALERIVNYHKDLRRYKKIFLIWNFTESAREWFFSDPDLIPRDQHPLIMREHKEKEITEFFRQYEVGFLDKLQQIISDSDLGIDCVVYKNLTTWYTTESERKSYNFKTIPVCWRDWGLIGQGMETLPNYISNARQLDRDSYVWRICNYDIDWAEQQAEILSEKLSNAKKCNAFVRGSHPTVSSHEQWAQLLHDTFMGDL
jgi:hypothetical protein